MNERTYQFNFEVYNSIDELNKDDAWLLRKAREITAHAYAPYSRFEVGAAARLANGNIVEGSNQENASYPVGLCAERTLLAAVASLSPNMAIDTIAVSYHNNNGESDHPISPCGICRQSLLEYETRVKKTIRLILGGLEGEIYVIPSAKMLLPLSFTNEDLK